jgi:hypothetical protein
MKRYTLTISLLVLTLGGCIKHGRSHPQTGPTPVHAIAPGQRLAIASMLRNVLENLPDNHVVACVFFRKMVHGYYYAYRPDTALVRMLRGGHEIVRPDQCPPTRTGGFRVFDLREPKLPPGYLDPYGVLVESQQYGRNEAAATIVVSQSSYEWTSQCMARRVSHNNWLGSCRIVSQVHLGQLQLIDHPI